MDDVELNDIPIFTQMRDEVLDFSMHALRSRGITEMLLDNLSDAEREEWLPKKKRKIKVVEGSKGMEQQKKKKQRNSKKEDDTTETIESTSRSSSKIKQRDGSSYIGKITHTTQEEDDEDEEEESDESGVKLWKKIIAKKRKMKKGKNMTLTLPPAEEVCGKEQLQLSNDRQKQ